jgi:dihydroorotase
MEKIGMVMCVHVEVTDPQVDVLDREAVFIDRVLTGIVRDFPALKIIFEHVTTRQAVEFVEAASANVAATITPQHMLLNRNALFQGGLRPHAYCLPVVKREEHRIAVRRAATSGSPKFFLGTDSAPHSVEAKQSSCGCAGIFNAPFALETYLSMFDEDGAIGHFEAFASRNGAAFYGLQLNAGTITLERREQAIPDLVEGLVPFLAGSTVGWRIAD